METRHSTTSPKSSTSAWRASSGAASRRSTGRAARGSASCIPSTKARPAGSRQDRQSLKAKHLAKTPYVSLSYWDQQHQQIYVDAKAEWVDDMARSSGIWELYKNTPPPLGYDPR